MIYHFLPYRSYIISCLIFSVGIFLTGCSQLSSEAFRVGLIQQGYNDAIYLGQGNTLPKATTPWPNTVILVPDFHDQREKMRERQNLWVSTLPIASAFAYWEKPKWLLWDEAGYDGYKTAGRDMSETFAEALDTCCLFSSVSTKTDEQADYLLQGTIEKLTLVYSPHCWGTSLFVGGSVFGPLGVPMGSWKIKQTISVKFIRITSNEVLWQQHFHTTDSGPIAAYYGRDPIRCGYPAKQLLMPILIQSYQGIKDALEAMPPPAKQTR